MNLTSGQLVSRAEISSALAEGFGIKQGERMVRYALEKFGVEAKDRRSREGQPGGPVSLYEPITLWTISSVYHRSRQTLKSGDDALAPYRELARKLMTEPGAAHIPGFVEDELLAAQLLLIGSPDLGMDPLHRRVHVREQPWLLQWCSAGEAFMRVAMQSWDDAYEMLLRQAQSDGALRSTAAQDRESAAYAFTLDCGHRWHESEISKERLTALEP